jgi:AraC-like DNA-binding protein
MSKMDSTIYVDVPEDPPAPKLIAVTIHDLLSRELPKIEPLLSPWLGMQTLNMVYAWRGVGKTHFALNVAYAVASGGEFLGWAADEPRGVLYLDGEMPGAAMQERLSSIVLASSRECDPENFRIITPDLQPSFMPDLATVEGQAAIEEHVTDTTRLIVVDNLSALVRRGGRENDAESWLSVAEWAMYQRARGRSVLFIHHAGKNGDQRGTSKREDILDTVICLKRPSDYDPAREGARFTIEFLKDRHRSAGEPFEAALSSDGHGGQLWTVRTLEASRTDQIIELAELGLTVTDIAGELGINKSTVSRALNKAEKEGRYKPRNKAAQRKRNKDSEDGKVVDIKTRRRRDVDDDE